MKNLLTIGNKAPLFTLTANGGVTISSKDFLEKKNLVLYFYPKDDTPGCTTEAKDFRDLSAKFTQANTVIIGVSKDSVKNHNKFKEKYCLPFTLGSDEDGAVCEAYGVWIEKSMYGKKYMGIQRATFLIDKKGVIAHIWPKVSITGHAAEVLKIVQTL